MDLLLSLLVGAVVVGLVSVLLLLLLTVGDRGCVVFDVVGAGVVVLVVLVLSAWLVARCFGICVCVLVMLVLLLLS